MAPRKEKGQKTKTTKGVTVQRFNKRVRGLHYDEMIIE